MSERPIPVSDDQRERQRETLGALFASSGLKLTPAAAAIGVSASQLSRYISAETVLPTPYYQAVADAFGISHAELVRRLLPDTDADASFDFRAELAAALPEAPRWAEELFREYGDAIPEGQKVIVRFIHRQRAAGVLSIPPQFRDDCPTSQEWAEPSGQMSVA